MFVNIEPYKSKKCHILHYQSIAALTPVYPMCKLLPQSITRQYTLMYCIVVRKRSVFLPSNLNLFLAFLICETTSLIIVDKQEKQSCVTFYWTSETIHCGIVTWSNKITSFLSVTKMLLFVCGMFRLVTSVLIKILDFTQCSATFFTSSLTLTEIFRIQILCNLRFFSRVLCIGSVLLLHIVAITSTTAY